MPDNWRKVENEKGFIFYVNSKNKKQWDHPNYADIKMRLDECNYVKYASYRVASKFRVLQHALHMTEMPLNIIMGVFERHKLGTMENSLPLESCDLEAVLSDIFFAANKQNHTNTDVDFVTELMINFIYNVYDLERKTNVDVLSTKISLALLSNCKLSELNKYLFSLCSDHNNCVTRLRLQVLITKICLLTDYLNETVSYGQHLVNSTIEHCFNNSPGLVGIPEGTFCAWLEEVPQVISWLPILHRLKISETVIHSGKCAVCKVTPLMGLKYKCVKCSNYVQCQRCFFTGRTSHSHKLSHIMKEYCRQKTSRILKENITNKFNKLLKWKYRVSEDVSVIDNNPISGTYSDMLLKPNEHNEPCNIEPLSSPLAQLQAVIRQLELQNKELNQILANAKRNDKDIKRYLEEHKQHVSTQISKLKILKDFFNSDQKENSFESNKTRNVLVQSTPMIQNANVPRNIRKGKDMGAFSPIPQFSELSYDAPNKTKLSLHSAQYQCEDPFNENTTTNSYCMKDISTWIGGQAKNHMNEYESLDRKKPPIEQTDLDDALAKLQQILVNNFSLDESLGIVDNCQLKSAVNEVEGVLSTIIDSVESNQHQNSAPISCATSSVDEFKSYSTASFLSARSNFQNSASLMKS